MLTAFIFQGHLFGTKSSHYITATYKGKYIHTVSCHDSETTVKLEEMKTYLKALNFTHYKDAGIGSRKPL